MPTASTSRLRVVYESAVCSFCWRILPLDELHRGEGGEALFCNDPVECAAEFQRWEQRGAWGTHPAYERMVG